MFRADKEKLDNLKRLKDHLKINNLISEQDENDLDWLINGEEDTFYRLMREDMVSILENREHPLEHRGGPCLAE